MKSAVQPTPRLVEALRVIVADDSMLIREGLVRLLAEAGIEVVSEAGTGEDLLRKVRLLEPDVVVVDIRMPPTHTSEGLKAAMEIRRQHPNVGVLLLSQFIDMSYADDLIADDASGVGYLLKDRVSNADEFVGALRRVAAGGSVIDPELVNCILRRRQADQLSEHERAVLGLIAQGRSNKAIAEQLVLSLHTVEKTASRIYRKLNIGDTNDDSPRVLAAMAYLHLHEPT